MTLWTEQLLEDLNAGRAAMLVTIVDVAGSVPREPGARMIVSGDGFSGTIGGGQLEFEALGDARAMLDDGASAALRKFALGPELGQCCGGTASLMFEPFSPADTSWVARLADRARDVEPAIRVARFDAGTYHRDVLSVGDVPDDDTVAEAVRAARTGERPFIAIIADGDCTIVEAIADTRQPLWLFGAGHVGRALAQALSPLPFAVTWIDGRADAFDGVTPAGVTTLNPSMPELVVDEALPGTMFLVMTHAHDLDQAICEAVLRRGDARYLGLIGSATKKARFLSRLRAHGLEEAVLDNLICPIGLPSIAGKEPAVIAASVVADLLARIAPAGTPASTQALNTKDGDDVR